MYGWCNSIFQSYLQPIIEVGYKSIAQPPQITTEPFSTITYNGIPNKAIATADYARSKNPLAFIQRYIMKLGTTDEYYDYASFGFGHKPKIRVITNAEIIKKFLQKILRDDGESISGGSDFNILTTVLKRFSPLTVKVVDVHSFLRRSYKQQNHGFGNINQLTALMAKTTTEFINDTFVDQGNLFNVTELMLHYTVKQTLEQIVVPKENINIPQLANLIDRIEKYVTAEILWSKNSFNPLKKKCLIELDENAKYFIHNSDGFIKEVNEEIYSEIEHNKLLTDLTNADIDEWLMSAATTILVIGSGTTRSALVSALLCLMEHPACQETLYEAVKDIDLTNEYSVELDGMLKNCAPLQNFIHEVFRLFPPISMQSRETTGHFDLQVGDNTIHFDPNTSIYLDYFHAHRDKNRWSNPLQFNPSRFEMQPDRMKEVQPFSFGPSTCLGKPFALALLNLMICALVQKFKICKPLDPDGHPINHQYEAIGGMTTRLNQDLEVRLIPR